MSARRKKAALTPWQRKRRRLLSVVGLAALLFSVVMFWRIQLASEVRWQIQGLRDAGVPLDLPSLNQRHPVPAETENGATEFRAAWMNLRIPDPVLMAQLPFKPNREIAVGKAIPPEQRTAMVALVTGNESSLAHCKAGAARKTTRYIETYTPSYDRSAMNAHLPMVNDLVSLLCSDSLLKSETGDSHGALDALGTALAVARSLEGDGLYESLSTQWELEKLVLTSLVRLLSQASYRAEELMVFSAYFSPERRVAQWQRMCDTEQCLFVSRFRQGRKRGFMRSVLIAGGVGDLNLRLYFGLAGAARSGFGATSEEQRRLQAEYQRLAAEVDGGPMIYRTTAIRMPPAPWNLMVAQWEEAVFADVFLAIFGYHAREGVYPATLDELVPDFFDDGLPTRLDSTPIPYAVHSDGFRIGDDDQWLATSTPVAP
mgnify:CR=1 FL=1